MREGEGIRRVCLRRANEDSVMQEQERGLLERQEGREGRGEGGREGGYTRQSTKNIKDMQDACTDGEEGKEGGREGGRDVHVHCT